MHINELFSLDGSCAVVIGGAGKVGYPMAEALAEAGARKCISLLAQLKAFQPAVERLKSSGLKAAGVAIDQADESSVLSTLESISNEYKTPDILINSGCYRPMRNFYSDSPDSWDESMEVNSRGLFITCRAFGNAMALQGKGSISSAFHRYGMVAPDMSIYDGVSFETEPDYPFVKGGIITYTKYLSSFYSKKNVRVNCISPGGVF